MRSVKVVITAMATAGKTNHAASRVIVIAPRLLDPASSGQESTPTSEQGSAPVSNQKTRTASAAKIRTATASA